MTTRMPRFPNAEDAVRSLGDLAQQAKLIYVLADDDLRAGLTDVDQIQVDLDRLTHVAVRVLTKTLDDRTIATYVLACWLDSMFPRTLVATYAARKAFERYDAEAQG